MFAIQMTPLDWGISAAAVLMLIFAARTLVSGKGRAQMGLGFALVASVVWTFAIGRQLADFTPLDGLRVAAGIFLLVPVFRVLFSHSSGSITTAVVSLLLASVIAGPVIAPFIDGMDSGVAPEIERLTRKIDSTDDEIDSLEATRDQVMSFAAVERAKLEGFGKKSVEEIESDADAMAALEKYAGYKTKLEEIMGDIKTLEGQRESLESTLTALQRGGDVRDSLARAEEIRAEVEREAERRDDRPTVESYVKRGEALEIYEREFVKADEPE